MSREIVRKIEKKIQDKQKLTFREWAILLKCALEKLKNDIYWHIFTKHQIVKLLEKPGSVEKLKQALRNDRFSELVINESEHIFYKGDSRIKFRGKL